MAEFKVNNVKVSTTSRFAKGGGVENIELVTFYVDDHGPFTKDFPAGHDNSTAIRQFIEAKVSSLRMIVSGYSS